MSSSPYKIKQNKNEPTYFLIYSFDPGFNRSSNDSTMKTNHSTEPWEEGLPAAARTLRNLLRDVDSASVPLWTGPQLDAAIFRYTEIFLPMLAIHLGSGDYTRETEVKLSAIKNTANEKLHNDYHKVKNGSMYKYDLADDELNREEFIAPFTALEFDCTRVAPIPPLDVAFCWALHRLSPKDYEADCMRLYGRKLETKSELEYVNVSNAGDPKSIVARLQWFCFSRAVRSLEQRKFPKWRKLCIEERKTFLPKYLWPRFTETKTEGKKKENTFPFEESTSWSKNYRNPLKYDIKAAARRQKQFLFNISRPYFDTDKALERGSYRYKRFLALMRDNPGKFLVPMYDIDLVWHAHILKDTAGYARDTKEFVGRFINHKEDDDRAEGGELNTGFATTVKLWEATYGEKYEDTDTNYKGKLPDSEERVFTANGTSVLVKADDEWRKSFIQNALTCPECKDKLAKFMCTKCQKEVIKAVRLKRGGHVRGGACGALYANGYVGALAIHSNAGGACGDMTGEAHGSWELRETVIF